MSLKTVPILAALIAGGCGQPVEDATVSAEPQPLTAVIGNESITGTFGVGDDQLKFSSRAVEPQVYELVLGLHGLTLSLVIDKKNEVADIDGFTSSSGADTQMTEEDRLVVLAFNKAFEVSEYYPRSGEAGDVMKRFTGVWAQFSSTLKLAHQILAEKDRSYTSICGLVNTYQYVIHDGPWLVGCDTDNWDPKSTHIALIASRSGSTQYLINGYWTTSTPDHRPYTQQKGLCYGDCGSGCPGGLQDNTWDCSDHDSCVRNGHSMAAVSCDDEFTGTWDDAALAPYCGGTG